MATTDEPDVAIGTGLSRWKRRLVIGLVVAMIGLGFLWWVNPLRGVPDIGDPFDPGELTGVEVADAGNAFVLYREAAARFSAKDGPATGARWEKASAPHRLWLENNREAIELYLEGSRRPDALYHRPETVRWDTLLNVTQALRDMSRATLFEATRREHEGDMAGAWECYRAILRSSRHSGRHGGVIERLVGMAMAREALGPMKIWAENPRVDGDLLRRAIQDAREAEGLTPPVSETLKGEYLMAVQSLRDPKLPEYLRMLNDQPSHPVQLGPFTFDWAKFRHNAGSLRMKGEPEKSIRLLKMVYANELAYCDLPEDQRPRFVLNEPAAIFEPAPGDPDEARAILEPGRIAELEGSLLGSLLDSPFGSPILPSPSLDGVSPVEADRRSFGELNQFLEKELRQRSEDTGRPIRDSGT